MNNYTEWFNAFKKALNGESEENFTLEQLKEGEKIYNYIEAYLEKLYDLTPEELDVMIKEHYPEKLL